jgi:hypothetical protein
VGGVAKGAGSTITNVYGFQCEDYASGGSTFAGAFVGAMSAGSGKWNCYMNGTAPNHFAGKVFLNTTSFTFVSGEVLTVNGETSLRSNVAASPAVWIYNGATSGDNIFTLLYTDGGTQRGSIDYNRGGGVVRYNTTSDMNLKTLIGDAPVEASIAILRNSRMREFYWNADKTRKPQIGPFAQELYQVFKGAVSRGGWDRSPGALKYRAWGVDRTAFTNHLIVGWKQHEQDIAAIKAHLGLN